MLPTPFTENMSHKSNCQEWSMGRIGSLVDLEWVESGSLDGDLDRTTIALQELVFQFELDTAKKIWYKDLNGTTKSMKHKLCYITFISYLASVKNDICVTVLFWGGCLRGIFSVCLFKMVLQLSSPRRLSKSNYS